MEFPVEFGYLVVEEGKSPQRIFYESSGKGNTIILIHAFFVDRRIWENQFSFLAGKGHHVVMYDVRGRGKSDVPRSEYSDSLDLKKLMDHLKIDSASIIGVSSGGRIAIDFALQFPGKVESLVLINSMVHGYSPSGYDEEKAWEEIYESDRKRDALFKSGKFREAVAANVEARGSGMTDSTKERLMEIAIDNYHVLKGFDRKFQKSPEPPAFERLQDIAAPTLVISGGKDFKGYRILSEIIGSRIRGSKMAFMENAGHIANMSSPEELNGIVLDFLGKI